MFYTFNITFPLMDLCKFTWTYMAKTFYIILLRGRLLYSRNRDKGCYSFDGKVRFELPEDFQWQNGTAISEISKEPCEVYLPTEIFGKFFPGIPFQLTFLQETSEFSTFRKFSNFLQISGELFIQPKIPKIAERTKMVRRFPEKISRKCGNCWISKKLTNQPTFRRFPQKIKWSRIPGKKILKIWV